MSLESTVEAPGPYAWDWSATTHDTKGSGSTVPEVLGDLSSALGATMVVPVEKGLQGWSDHLDCFDAEGYRVGRVYYGGDRTDVHVVSSSTAADSTRETLAWHHHAKTARVDTRVDSRVDFDALADVLDQAASMYGSLITEVRSRVGDESKGRTVYLGAPSSAIRVRLYEKWLESPGEYEDGTNRVEVQLRPPSRVKPKVSGWSRAQTFGASKVTRTLADLLGKDLEDPETLHVRRGTPDLERSLAAMRDQYGKAASRWLALSGGDLSTLEQYLTAKVPLRRIG